MTGVNYEVVRSNRKTIAIYVKRDASVLVRAPLYVSGEFIEGFVNKKKDWIDSALDAAYKNIQKKDNFTLNRVRFLGKSYSLIRNDKSSIVSFDGQHFDVPMENELATLKAWLKKAAREIVLNRLELYAEVMGLTYNNLRIGSSKTSWGSCSSKGNLSFSYMLVFASGKAIDYVIVHELAHLMVPNHSDDFWEIVKQYIADIELSQQELKKLEEELIVEPW